MQAQPAKLALLRIVVLCCFAASTVPRAAVYTHQHDGNTPGHVHAWDGARLDDVRQLIDEAEHGHSHAHPHPLARAEQGVEHQHDHAEASAPVALHSRRESHGPGLREAQPSGSTHSHWQAPFQIVARAAAISVVFDRRRTPLAAPRAMRPVAAALPALRARSPPLSASA